MTLIKINQRMSTVALNGVAILSIFTLLNACSPVLYGTPGVNAPLFESKGEYQIGLNYSAYTDIVFSDAKGFSMQAAHSFSDKTLGIVSFASVSDLGEWDVRSNYFETGFGIYKDSSEWRSEVIFGVGLGSF